MTETSVSFYSHFASAIVDHNYSGLDDSDRQELSEFEARLASEFGVRLTGDIDCFYVVGDDLLRLHELTTDQRANICEYDTCYDSSPGKPTVYTYRKNTDGSVAEEAWPIWHTLLGDTIRYHTEKIEPTQ